MTLLKKVIEEEGKLIGTTRDGDTVELKDPEELCDVHSGYFSVPSHKLRELKHSDGYYLPLTSWREGRDRHYVYMKYDKV